MIQDMQFYLEQRIKNCDEMILMYKHKRNTYDEILKDLEGTK